MSEFPNCSYIRTHLRKRCSYDLGSDNRHGRHGNATKLLAKQRAQRNRSTYVSQLVVALVSVTYEVVVSLFNLSAMLIGSLTRNATY